MKKKNVSLHNIKNILKDKLEEYPETIKKKNNGLEIKFEKQNLIGVFDFFKALECKWFAFWLKSCEETDLYLNEY